MDIKRILDWKNWLNTHAELGWQEIQTTDYIAKQLHAKPIKRGFGGGSTGLVYKIGNGTKSILLRADIDGLKTAHGIAHSCGHSTHMASLMGVVDDTIALENELTKQDKSIYFLFQPAEETFPSGGATFVAECPDIMRQITAAYAIHVRPLMQLGYIGLQPGSLWARGDYMEIEVVGKMVHIKNNEKGIDALHAASLLIQKIRQIQKKHSSIRIGIGVMEGGRQPNTVADHALLKGDIRLKKDSQQQDIKNLLLQVCKEVEKLTHTQVKLNYYTGCPVVYNDAKLTREISQHVNDMTLVSKGLFSFGCEDFSYISQKVPSVIALIGTGDAYDLHEENCTISDKGTINAYHYFKTVVSSFIDMM